MSFQTYGATRLSTHQPWGLLAATGTRLLCADGKVRAPSRLAASADTYFSVPAAMRIKGVTVTGYATTEETSGAPYVRAYVFRQHTGQPGHNLPQWPEHRDHAAMDALIRLAHP